MMATGIILYLKITQFAESYTSLYKRKAINKTPNIAECTFKI